MRKGLAYSRPTPQRGQRSRSPNRSILKSLASQVMRWPVGAIRLRAGVTLGRCLNTRAENARCENSCRPCATSNGEPQATILTALRAAFRAEVDEIVRVFDDIEIVLDGDHRVAHVDQAMENLNQLFHVDEVQTGGRFVEHVKRLAVGFLAELISELDALGFAAGKRVARLAERDVAHADVFKNFKRPGDFRKGMKDRHGFFDGHAKNVADVFVVEANAQAFLH